MTTTDDPQAETSDSTGAAERGTRFAAGIVRVVDGVAARIAYVMETRPNATRVTIGAFMLIALMFAVGRQVRAASMMQDEIQTAFNISTYFRIFDNSIALATYIFATLAGLTVIVRVLAYYIKNQSVRGLGQVVLSSVLSLGIPFVIIQAAPVLLPAVSMIGLQVTDIITGNSTSNVSGGVQSTPDPQTLTSSLTDIYNATFGAATGAIPALTPKAIVDKGVNIAWPLVQEADRATNQAAQAANRPQTPGHPFNDSAYQYNQMFVWFVMMLAISVIGAFVFIAVELVIAYMQIYLVLPIAAFSLGFLGSPATRHFGTGYWTVVVQALVKFATIVFVIGFAMSLSTIWAATIKTINVPVCCNGTVDLNVMKTAISAAAVSFSLLYIVRVLPGMFGAVLSGMAVGADGNSAESMIQSSAAQRGRPAPGGNGAPPAGKIRTPSYDVRRTGKYPA